MHTMIIKSQEIIILAKLLARLGDENWSQNSIAFELYLRPYQINSALKRLVIAGLITTCQPPGKPQTITQACKEFFIHGLKYVFPAKLGEIVRVIRTSYAASSFKGETPLGSDAIPVWPYGEGEERGAAL
jgi:hypothetical protein